MPTRLAVVPRLYSQPEPRRATVEESGEYALLDPARCLSCQAYTAHGICLACGATYGVDARRMS